MSTFVGGYVLEMRDAMFACSASGLHLQFIGKPGGGKTDIALACAKALYGDRMVMTRFNPSTPVEKVEGFIDYAALMKQDPEWHIITAGTPYDPDCDVWIADEIHRPNQAVQDKMLDTLNRYDMDDADWPVVFGTANFLPKDERAEALLDRFGLTYWLKGNGDYTPKDVSVARMRANGKKLLVPGLETETEQKEWQQRIFDARRASYTERSIKAVSECVEHIAKVAEEGLVDSNGNAVRSFGPINNRRSTYWTDLLAKTSILYYGTAEFDEVHPKALAALSYAWTSKSQEEADDWRMLMGNVVDPIQSAIDHALKDAYEVMRQTADGMNKIKAAYELGKILNQTSDNMKVFVEETDPRYQQAVYELQSFITQYVREEAASV